LSLHVAPRDARIPHAITSRGHRAAQPL